MLEMCEALYKLDERATNATYGGIGQQARVKVAAQSLVSRLTKASGGITVFLAQEVLQGLREALASACRQARAWRDAGLGDITVSVNLSAGQLRDTTMVADLKKILGRTGCEASWLQFEITETSMVRDVVGAGIVLSRLRGLGVRSPS